MDKYDIIKRAREIIEGGPLPKGFLEHGEYCPYCAMALAKSMLDTELNQGIEFRELLVQSITGFKPVESDKPLEEAADLIDDVPLPSTQENTLLVFSEILNKQEP